MKKLARLAEVVFETLLFNSRLIVVLAVIGSLVGSVLMFVPGSLVIVASTIAFIKHPSVVHGQSEANGAEDLSITLISSVDNYLFATVPLIFSMGVYELFISKIDPASRTPESGPNWLAIHSLDDLKRAVSKVVLMILIVRLFEVAVKMKYEQPIHLFWLGISMLFVAASLYLQHAGHRIKGGPDKGWEPDKVDGSTDSAHPPSA